MISKTVLTIPEQIVRQLRKDIYSGKYASGEAIKETALSKEFGVSRGPVRHALLQLTKEGLLDSIANVGVRVAEKPTSDVFSLIIKMRMDIELFVFNEVINDLSSDDFEELDDIMSRMHKACSDNDINTIYQHDYRFHEFFIMKYSDKHVLELWHSIMSRMMMRYARFDDLMESYTEHLRIVEALKQRNINKIAELLGVNIQ